MTKFPALLRRPVLAAPLLVLALGGTADAAGDASGSRLYACVTNDFRTLNLTTRGGRCDGDQQKISWAIEGPRGKTGARGARGSAGATGATGAKGDAGPAGATGARGETGATGPQGPAGPAGSGSGGAGPAGPQGPIGLTGPVGPIGLTGPVGPIGATGPAGRDGTDGRDGLQGIQGDPGPAGATLMTSSGHATVTTIAGGFNGTVTALPLSGVRASALTYSEGSAPPFTASQLVAAGTTFTTLRLEGRLTQAMALVGSTVTPEVTLVVNGFRSSLSCYTTPALTGILAIGTGFSASCSGAVAVNAGDLAFVAVSVTATGITLINTVEADVTAGLA